MKKLYTILILFMALMSSCSSTQYVNSINVENRMAEELDLVYTRKLFFIDLYLNGKRGRFLVDTGASISILDVNQSKYYHFNTMKRNDNVVGVGGSSNIYGIKNCELSTKDGLVVLVNFKGSDLSALNNSMRKDGLEVVGVIGSDFLMNANAIINYSNRSLSLNYPHLH
jgi:hypothetical protein